MLNITVEKNDSAAVFSLKGRIDTMTAPDFEKSVMQTIDTSNEFVFDFSEVQYISSAGLRVLLKTQKLLNASSGTMKLIGVGEPVMEVFEITGFTDFLAIEKK